MAKTKISEFSSVAADNTDVSNINIAEGCSPANLNNAVRSLMALLKDQQTGTSGDPFTVAGTLVSSGQIDVTGAFRLDGTAGASGQALVSAGGSTTPTWASIPTFVAGMIMMWSGTIATIPSGWLLCNGSNGTPDLRNRFIVGAHSDNAGVANTTITGSSTQTGGSKDAITVAHTHTGTTDSTSLTGSATYISETWESDGTATGIFSKVGGFSATKTPTSSDTSSTGQLNINATHTHGFTTGSTGSSGTNANLVPYYALAFIMKS